VTFTAMGLVEIGKIIKPHGITGMMRVQSYLESDEVLCSLEEAFVAKEQDEAKCYKVKRIRFQGRHSFLLAFEGIDDRDKADGLVGCGLLIASDKFKALPEGEYYWRDIIGLTVISEDGRILGEIESIFTTGSNDVYVCTGGEREIFLPAISDVIIKIEVDKGMMTVRLLEGL
jgi:16S rRNA processing protein RimM